jgi:hypothetical protein
LTNLFLSEPKVKAQSEVSISLRSQTSVYHHFASRKFGSKIRFNSTKAIAEAATTALEVFNVPIEDALFTGILRVKGCVEARNAASMCHHLQSDVQSTLKILKY